MRINLLGLLLCCACAASPTAMHAQSLILQNAIVLPTDVRKISYPFDYQNAKPVTISVADPYCAIATDTVAFPADYMGAFPLPEIRGAPLPAGILRGAAVKDYWEFGRNNPATNVGCGGTLKEAFTATLDRFARLGIDHVDVSQGVQLIDGARPEMGMTDLQVPFQDFSWIAAEAGARGLKVHLSMQVGGAHGAPLPPNPVPADWASRFLDAYANFIVEQAKAAASAGFEAIQIDFCCFPVDWQPHAQLWLARMKVLADRTRQVFPGKIIYGQTAPWISGDPDLMSRIDWLMFDAIIWNMLTEEDNRSLTVDRLKSHYMANWSALASALGPARKPVKWRVFAQSHRDYYKPDVGWIEDGFCVQNCMQRSVKTDFSVQAIGYEAWLEGIKEQKFFNTVSVDPEASWFVDVMLPKDAFPNISQSWRNKPAESILAAWFKSPPVLPVTAIEFYNRALDHYFVTWVADEIGKLDSGILKGWARTGQSFKVHDRVANGTSPVCRIYIPPGKGDGHFFGRDTSECNGTMNRNPTFVLESESFFYLSKPTLGSCEAGHVAVYRVFSNRLDANHRYTTDRATRDQMVASGWIAEGDGPDTVVMCAPL